MFKNILLYGSISILNTIVGLTFIFFYNLTGINLDTSIILGIISTEVFKLFTYGQIFFKRKITISVCYKFALVSLLIIFFSETIRVLFGSDLLLISIKFFIIIILSYLLHSKFVFVDKSI